MCSLIFDANVLSLMRGIGLREKLVKCFRLPSSLAQDAVAGRLHFIISPSSHCRAAGVEIPTEPRGVEQCPTPEALPAGAVAENTVLAGSLVGYRFKAEVKLRAWLLSQSVGILKVPLVEVVMLASSLVFSPEDVATAQRRLDDGTVTLPGAEVVRRLSHRLNLLNLLWP